MLAARMYEGAGSLRLEDVPVPEPRGDQVLVRVAGAGVCRSDLHVLDGEFAELMRPPVTMGHEIAGWVEALGPDASGLETGEPVVVMVGWGCGHCAWCVSGAEQLCPDGNEAGATVDGGFAEFVLVPHRRHLVPLGALDPVEATPLGCAGITSYAAVGRARPVLAGGATAVVVGAGGLGQFAIQLLREVGTDVVAVDGDARKRALAVDLGARSAVPPGAETSSEVRELTGGEGARAALDFVGSDETLALCAGVVGRRGVIVLVGLAEGTLPFSFTALAPEASLTTVVAGGIGDLQAVVRLVHHGRLRTQVERYPLARIDDAIADLRAGRVAGRAVLTP